MSVCFILSLNTNSPPCLYRIWLGGISHPFGYDSRIFIKNFRQLLVGHSFLCKYHLETVYSFTFHSILNLATNLHKNSQSQCLLSKKVVITNQKNVFIFNYPCQLGVFHTCLKESRHPLLITLEIIFHFDIHYYTYYDMLL